MLLTHHLAYRWMRCVQGAISLSRQADYFREYQSRVAASAGEQRAKALTSGSIYVVSAGTSDYVQNYYVNPVLGAAYTPDQFADALMQPFTSFVEVTIYPKFCFKKRTIYPKAAIFSFFCCRIHKKN